MSKEKGLYKIPAKCERCGGEDIYVEAIVGNNDAIFVEYICSDCNYASGMIPKVENLKKRTNTPLQKWKSAVFERDKSTCVICGGKANEAHHIIPVRNCREEMYNINNGVALCWKCHRKVHHGEYHSNANALVK